MADGLHVRLFLRRSICFITRDTGHAMRDGENRASIELSMIVKNGACTLRRCLDSVAGAIDRIFIGDTGSTDESAEIAQAYGAEVVRVPWQDDFSKARNAVLAQAQCDWILVLDADEMLDKAGVIELRRTVADAEPNVFGYDIWRWNYVRELHTRSAEQGALPNPVLLEATRPYPAYVRSLNTRLFRRHPQITFERPVHETVAGCMDYQKFRRSQASFVIHHFGLGEDPEDVRTQKNEFYQRLGQQQILSNPFDSRAHFELGLGELEHYRRPKEALDYFLKAEALSPRDASPWLFAGICLTRLGRYREAVEHLARSERLDGRSIVLFEAIGDLHFRLGDFKAAQQAYGRALQLGSVSELTAAKLGATEVRLGLGATGIRRMVEAVESQPRFLELYEILATGAFIGGDAALAIATADQRLNLGELTSFQFLLAATLHEYIGNSQRAEELLTNGLFLFPDDQELDDAMKRISKRK
jgi:glycosyltransferase involved in cell wall biosynthesis